MKTGTFRIPDFEVDLIIEALKFYEDSEDVCYDEIKCQRLQVLVDFFEDASFDEEE